MRKNFEQTMITPLPVLMIGTYDENEKPNIMNIAWGGQCGPKHIAINIGITEPEKKTLTNIKNNKEFTVSFATKETCAISDYLGITSGNTTDKIKEANLTEIKSENINAPLFKEYPLTLECKVLDMIERYGEMHITGEIINISADESILTNDEVDMEKLQAIIYDSIGKTYRVIGEVVGQAFKEGEKIIK